MLLLIDMRSDIEVKSEHQEFYFICGLVFHSILQHANCKYIKSTKTKPLVIILHPPC